MAEDANAAIHIRQLNLRMPGNSADTAHRVASGIGRSLAQRLPTGTQRHLGALSVRVQVLGGATEAEISDAVAAAIMRSPRE